MSVYDKPFDTIIGQALKILFDERADVFTFGFYHDHESHAVSVCADTKDKSKRSTLESNRFRKDQFLRAIQEQDLESAARWNSNTGRSFSLGDFRYVNLGRQAIRVPNNSAPFYRAMVDALMRNSDKIAALASNPEELVMCCSTKNSEVGLIWYHEAG